MFHVLITALLLHPVHETISEVEWNAETKRLEVALRLDLLDEQWLRKTVGRQEQDDPKWAIRYLRQKFRIAERPKHEQPDSTTYRWLGRDEEGSHVWWYFEIEPAESKRPTWIEQQILFEREENYTNRILILDQVPHRSLNLTIQRPKANLNQAADEPNSIPADRRSRLDRRRND